MGNNLGSYSEYTSASPLSVMRWVIPGSYSGARLDTISAADTPIAESW
jgi:hypothetical protein